ncbi:transposase [Bradyrhizobium elkanii]
MIEAVADRLEGSPRQLRRRWSDEFKAQVVTEALEPGASISAIARRHVLTERSVKKDAPPFWVILARPRRVILVEWRI